jgi:hypothetical protein
MELRETFEDCTWLHSDNAHPHIALSAVQCLPKHDILWQHHILPSPWISLAIFSYFPKLKAERKGRKFNNKKTLLKTGRWS